MKKAILLVVVLTLSSTLAVAESNEECQAKCYAQIDQCVAVGNTESACALEAAKCARNCTEDSTSTPTVNRLRKLTHHRRPKLTHPR